MLKLGSDSMHSSQAKKKKTKTKKINRQESFCHCSFPYIYVITALTVSNSSNYVKFIKYSKGRLHLNVHLSVLALIWQHIHSCG